MDRKYQITEKSVVFEDNKYITYGIECIADNNILDKFDDISLDKNEVSEICNCLNKNKIPIVHFRDIIEDYLTK